jgi:DNA-binding Lrp family transcriptional regulator
MSRKTRIPVSTLYDKIKVHENELITKHTTLIEFGKLGFNTRAKIIIKVRKQDREELKNYLIKNPCLNSVYKINNGFDFLIEAIFRNIKEMEDFMEEMEEKFTIKSKQVFYIVDDLKREGFLSNPENIDLVNL